MDSKWCRILSIHSRIPQLLLRCDVRFKGQETCKAVDLVQATNVKQRLGQSWFLCCQIRGTLPSNTMTPAHVLGESYFCAYHSCGDQFAPTPPPPPPPKKKKKQHAVLFVVLAPPCSRRRTSWNPRGTLMGGTLVEPYLRAANDNLGAYLG